MNTLFTILLVIVLAFSALVIWKWNTWFGNPPETAYVTPATPDRVILTMGEDGTHTRRISWRCDTTLTEGWVELTQENTSDTLKLPAQGALVSSRSGHSAFYRTELSGLQSGATYHYRVVNAPHASAWYTFSIPQPDSALSFIYIGDIQDQVEGSTQDLFRSINRQHPEVAFWALGGDVIERPTDTYWSYWYSTMDSIAGKKPFIAATGNHEYLKGVIKVLDPRWTYSFSNPENSPKEFAGRSYVVNFKDLCYIVIDTDGIQGAVSLYRHRDWLKKVLSTCDKKWKIVMMHHPVYSVREGRNNFYVRYTFKPLFEAYGVDLVLQGHDHGYSRITTKTKNLQKRGPVYIVSSSSPKAYNIGFDRIHDRLGSNLQLYQYITIQGDTLCYKAYTPEQELYDDLSLIHHGDKAAIVIDHAEQLPEHLELPPAYRNGKKVNLEKYRQKVKERETYKKAAATKQVTTGALTPAHPTPAKIIPIV